MREVLFYRWRVPDARRPGKLTTTGHRLTAEEAQRLHPGAVPVGEPEKRWVPDGPDEFAYTGAFQHEPCQLSGSSRRRPDVVLPNFGKKTNLA